MTTPKATTTKAARSNAPVPADSKTRCFWATGVPDFYEKYHDEEWCRPEYEEQIRAALAQLDVKRAEVKRPLLKATYQKCNAVRVFLNELTGVSLSKMHISGDLADAGESSPSKDYVLWVEESPDKIQLMKDLCPRPGLRQIPARARAQNSHNKKIK